MYNKLITVLCAVGLVSGAAKPQEPVLVYSQPSTVQYTSQAVPYVTAYAAPAYNQFTPPQAVPYSAPYAPQYQIAPSYQYTSQVAPVTSYTQYTSQAAPAANVQYSQEASYALPFPSAGVGYAGQYLQQNSPQSPATQAQYPISYRAAAYAAKVAAQAAQAPTQYVYYPSYSSQSIAAPATYSTPAVAPYSAQAVSYKSPPVTTLNTQRTYTAPAVTYKTQQTYTAPVSTYKPQTYSSFPSSFNTQRSYRPAVHFGTLYSGQADYPTGKSYSPPVTPKPFSSSASIQSFSQQSSASTPSVSREYLPAAPVKTYTAPVTQIKYPAPPPKKYPQYPTIKPIPVQTYTAPKTVTPAVSYQPLASQPVSVAPVSVAVNPQPVAYSAATPVVSYAAPAVTYAAAPVAYATAQVTPAVAYATPVSPAVSYVAAPISSAPVVQYAAGYGYGSATSSGSAATLCAVPVTYAATGLHGYEYGTYAPSMSYVANAFPGFGIYRKKK